MKKLNLKKLFVFAMLAVVPVTFCGCELSDLTAFDKNMDKYLNQTAAIATGDTTIKITLEDLLFAYNNYGYQYEVNDGLSREEAIKETLKYEIQRQLAIKEARNLYVNEMTNAEYNIAWEKTYSHINSQIAAIEKEIREEKGIPSQKTEAEKEEEKSKFIKEEYIPKASLNLEGKIVLNEDVIDKGYKGDANVELLGDKTNFYDSFMKYRNITTQEISDLALTRYIAKLRINEEGRNLSKADKDVLSREIKRVYEVEEDNLFVTKFETEFHKKNHITEEDVLNFYKSNVKHDHDRYALELSYYYNEVSENMDNVYYHPNTEYKFVEHILIQYTEEQKALISTWKNYLASGIITQEDYDANMEWIKTQITTRARDNEANYYGEEKNVSAIFNEVKFAVENSADKAKTFADFVYKYNADPGNMNTNFNYVVGDTQSGMVAEFTEVCRNLYNFDKMEIINEQTNIAYTEYGAHIIVYVDDAKNIIDYNDLENITIEKLASTKLKGGSDKTMFNKIYDELFESLSSFKYSNYQTNLIAQLEEGLTIKYYKNVYKNLMK